MISVVFPDGLNWFYERLARSLEDELRRLGVSATAIPAHELAVSPPGPGACVLLVSAAECAASADRTSQREAFLAAVRCFDRRVLINYDSLHAHWFFEQLKLGPGLFTEIFDIAVKPQAGAVYAGLPYRWIPEALWLLGANQKRPKWTAGRAFPWAIVGHVNENRAALVSALIRSEEPHGFVYLPPLKAYGQNTGLDEERLGKVLENSDFYIWNSHHRHPYHEGVRAIQAVAAGAAPAKIEPLYADRFSEIPWVYPSLEAMDEAKRRSGPGGLHRVALAFLEQFPPLGVSVRTALAA